MPWANQAIFHLKPPKGHHRRKTMGNLLCVTEDGSLWLI